MESATIPATKGHRRTSDILFILWAGGTALLSYSLVYALRKPFTAASFDGLSVFGMDYKLAISIIQLLGYVFAKLLGIKYISELKPEGRLKFIIGSAALSEVSLVAFGMLPLPYNIVALFFNGLSLGCMWGVLFSFLEGRRTTDILACLMGVSMAISSGFAKSLGLYTMETFHVSEFWMPALIGAIAFPLLSLSGWVLTRLPQPTREDIEARSKRSPLNGQERRALVVRFLPFLAAIFGANLLLTVMRDVKEDFIVRIIDVSTISHWAFAQTDGAATLLMLGIFGVLACVKDHFKVLCILLFLSMGGMLVLNYLGVHKNSLPVSTTTWLFLQSFCIDIAYLSFQTIFFERFIAYFRIHGNVGFFIITIDFIGYVGTLGLLLFKELANTDMDWSTFYAYMNQYIGIACCLAFAYSIVYLVQSKRKRSRGQASKPFIPQDNYLTTTNI